MGNHTDPSDGSSARQFGGRYRMPATTNQWEATFRNEKRRKPKILSELFWRVLADLVSVYGKWQAIMRKRQQGLQTKPGDSMRIDRHSIINHLARIEDRNHRHAEGWASLSVVSATRVN